MPDRVRFTCPTCGRPITGPLAPLPADQTLAIEDRVPALPAGFHAPGDDDLWTGSAASTVVNLADLVDVRRHPDARRLNGCCGLDGCDGPNLVCAACGGEVGVERSDCWMPHAAFLLPAARRERTA